MNRNHQLMCGIIFCDSRICTKLTKIISITCREENGSKNTWTRVQVYILCTYIVSTFYRPSVDKQWLKKRKKEKPINDRKYHWFIKIILLNLRFEMWTIKLWALNTKMELLKLKWNTQLYIFKFFPLTKGIRVQLKKKANALKIAHYDKCATEGESVTIYHLQL